MKYLIKEIGSDNEVYYYGTHNATAMGEDDLWRVRSYAYKSKAAADRALQQKEHYADIDREYGRPDHTFEIVEI